MVKSFANEDVENQKFKIGNDNFLESKKTNYQYMGLFQAGVGTFTTSIQICIIITGAVMIAKGSLNISDLITFLLYVSVFTEPIRTIVDFTEQFQNGYTGFERFMEIMNIEPDIVDAKDAKELKSVRGSISFDDVSFRYNENMPNVIDDLSSNYIYEPNLVSFLNKNTELIILNIVFNFYPFT